MDVAAKKLHVGHSGDSTHIKPSNTEDLYHQQCFKVDTHDKSQMWNMVTMSKINNSLKIVFSDIYNIIVTPTFDRLTIKCHHCIILSYIRHLCKMLSLLVNEFLGYGQKHILWVDNCATCNKIPSSSSRDITSLRIGWT